MNYSRLADVFITGPLQLYTSLHIKNNAMLRVWLMVTGIMTIVYNLHNYLLLDSKSTNTNYFGWFTHPVHGKQQLHRLYNLVIMYPLFTYIYKTQNASLLFLLNILVGFSFNLVNFLTIWGLR